MEGKYQYHLSESELLERGRRQAVIDGRIDLREDEKSTANAKVNAEIKALKTERRALSLAVREGYEWRPSAEQQEMEMVLAECVTCLHQHRYTYGTILDDKPCENCGLVGSMKEKT